MTARLEAKPLPRTRAEAFHIVPNVLIDNKASNRFTVVEINARDRPALLYSLAYALFQSKVTIHSAHVATYGERAVDTFYLTDLLGGKLESKEIGRASCRERMCPYVEISVGAVSLKTKKKKSTEEQVRRVRINRTDNTCDP